MRDVLLIEPNAPEVTHWRRGEDGTWTRYRVGGIDGAVDLPGLGIALPLATLYEGVAFPAGPRLLRS